MELVTNEDLRIFRVQLLNDIKVLLQSQLSPVHYQYSEGVKTKDVRRVLGCSVNKLISLRISGKIRWKKIGGTVYYSPEDVRRLLEEGY
jgi:hypothetical protein